MRVETILFCDERKEATGNILNHFENAYITDKIHIFGYENFYDDSAFHFSIKSVNNDDANTVDVYTKYKNEIPIILYILIDNILYLCEIKYIDFEFGIEAYYKFVDKYDVSNSEVYKLMLMIGIPEDGLTDGKIQKMIKQGTQLEMNIEEV